MLVLFSCRIFLDDSFTKIPFNYCSLNLDKNLASKVSLKNGLLKTEWHKKGPLLMRSTHMQIASIWIIGFNTQILGLGRAQSGPRGEGGEL